MSAYELAAPRASVSPKKASGALRAIARGYLTSETGRAANRFGSKKSDTPKYSFDFNVEGDLKLVEVVVVGIGNDCDEE